MTGNSGTKNSYYPMQVEKGQKYFWCSCGLSQKYPFCDGSHKGTGLKSVHFIPESAGVVNFCACGKTKTVPECDGDGCQFS